MTEAILANTLFWAAFAFSAGPFWTATMAAANSMSFPQLYKEYVLYLIFGWLPMIVTVSFVVTVLGGLNDKLNLAMHLAGSLVIFYMAYKMYLSRPGVAGDFNFDFKAMSILTWTNPKVWLLVPVGFLSARFSDSTILNASIYYITGVPVFLVAVLFWGSVGKLGAKVSLSHINKFNAMLMAAFGVYLLYAGYTLL